MDECAEDILERAQAGQRKLEKKMQESASKNKRFRLPCSEKVDNGEEGTCDQEESPKRFCRDEHEKENVNSELPTMPLRGLAALRKHNFIDDCQPTVSLVRVQEIQEVSSKSNSTCPKRLNTKLAVLSSQINQWDDKPRQLLKSPLQDRQLVSDDIPADERNVGIIPPPPPLPPIIREKTSSEPVALRLPTPANGSPLKPPRSQPNPNKKSVWDDAIVATLESQGFTKTPSASKLLYDYETNSVRRKVEDYELATKTTSAETVDPASLPLSAKRALFESGTNLSQKAAIFNKGSASSPKFPQRPFTSSAAATTMPSVKTQSPRPTSQISSTEKKPIAVERSFSAKASNTPKTPASKNVGLSPVKSIGEHTRKIQEKLFAQSQQSACAEIAMRQKMERQKEMAVLNNRWNREEENTLQSSTPTRNNSSDDTCSESLSEEPANDEQASTSDGSYSRDANSICRHLDEMLDDALNEDVSTTETFDSQFVEEVDSSVQTKSESGDCSSSPHVAVFTDNQLTPEQNLEIKSTYKFVTAGSGSSRGDEEPVELTHTISVYRKQKQEFATPPVRCVVKRKEVVSPPSPQTDPVTLAAQLKGLQEELFKQEVSLRQASQVVALCSTTPEFHSSPQHVEGEKLLLIAVLRRHATKQEIERLKTEAVLGSGVADDVGILTVSELRLPLKREFLSTLLEHPRSSDEVIHHFFCVLKYREKVVSTEMLTTSNDVTAGTLSFSNHICLQGLGGNFSVVFEVYALQTCKYIQEKKSNHRKDHSKVKLTPKLRKTEAKSILSPSCSTPVGSETVRTSNFGQVGHTRFHLHNCRNRCFSLEKVPDESPLEGRLDVKLQLHANVSIEERGFLTMFEDISGFGAWHRRWFVLSWSHLCFWKYPDEETRKEPMGKISLEQCISPAVNLVPRDVCARPNTFQLLCVRPQSRSDHNTLVTQSHNSFTTVKYLLSADTKEERIVWSRKLTEALAVLRLWNTDALRPLEDHH